MVSAKDLRDAFEDIRQEAGKRAAEMVSDAKIPEMTRDITRDLTRRNEPPGLLLFALGLALGAVVGIAIGIVVTPYAGDETRRRIGKQVERVRRQGEEQIEQMRAGNGEIYARPSTGEPV